MQSFFSFFVKKIKPVNFVRGLFVFFIKFDPNLWRHPTQKITSSLT